MLADELLKGSIDTHLHGFPEIAFDVGVRVEDYEIARLAEDAGMLGFVLKSHIWPTVGRAYYLNQKFPNVKVFPSITLNLTVGGLSPISVESAARQGAKILFMPTWSAANDLSRGGFSTYMKEYLHTTKNLKDSDGIRILGATGGLTEEVVEILEIAKEYRMVIATGHISPKESLSLVKEAKSIGDLPFIFSHPDSRYVGGTLEDMKAMVDKGAYVEICALGMMPAFKGLAPLILLKP
jgi:hypothetical protein